MSYVLLLGLPGVGKCKLLKSVADSFENVVWISTTYSFESVRKGLGKKAWIIDAFSWGMKKGESERDIVLINPCNLNEISLAFSKILEKVGREYILVLNSISGLAIYNPLQRIISLLRVLLTKVENDKAKAIFTLVSGAQSRQFEIGTMMFFPNIVELFEKEIKIIKSARSDLDKGSYEVGKAKEILIKMLEA